jgi:hypothetical protein
MRRVNRPWISATPPCSYWSADGSFQQPEPLTAIPLHGDALSWMRVRLSVFLDDVRRHQRRRELLPLLEGKSSLWPDNDGSDPLRLPLNLDELDMCLAVPEQ